MDESEFDKFAEEYSELHQRVLGPSGEDPEFFANYKVQDTLQLVQKQNFPPNLSILDFGSGIGGSVPYFLKYFPDCQLTCLDVSRKSLEIGIERFGDTAQFLHFDGKNIPSDDNSYHIIFTACVFHHIPPDMHALLIKEIHRILKPGGVFIAFEHNPLNFLTIRAVNACSYDENAILIPGKKFRGLLKEQDFNDDKLRYRIFFPKILGLFRPLERFLRWVPLGAQYYVSAQKPD